MPRLLFAFVGLLVLPAWCLAQTPADTAGNSTQAARPAVDFHRDVRPILAARCFRCHSDSLKQEGGLKLDQADGIRAGGDNGPVIVAGKSDESRLIQAVVGSDELRMPPEGAPLTDAQIQILRRWIESGAVLPTDDSPPAHWSFAPLQRPVPPNIAPRQQAAVRSPIDAFLAAQRESRDVTPTFEASPSVWLRRVHLDLIGLPPTEAELAEFAADESPDARERIVDRLLASPAHGERWGRHWMDVWRYSDWDGYGNEVRESQPHIWRWRDWIIESLNADKAYDQMVVEMLAGDELAPDDPATLRATGFLVRNWFKFNRNVWLDNTIEHTGKAFLGLTLNCARCHDHMYDPIKQSEYYALRAVFEPYDIRTDRIPGQPDSSKDGLVRAFDKQPDAATFLFVRGDEKQPLKDKPVGPALPKAVAGSRPLNAQPVALPPAAYYPGSQAFVHAESLAAAQAAVASGESSLAAAKSALAQASSQRQAAAVAATAASTSSPGSPSSPTPTPMLAPMTKPAQTPAPMPAAPAKPPIVFSDDFAAAKPQLWTPGAGTFQYRDGHVVQTEPLDQQCGLTSTQPLPRDFIARFKFRITGGDVYRSLGLSFDASDDQQSTFVYVSAYAGGPKLQLAYRRDGRDSYPTEAMKSLPIELNRAYDMTVAVRGELINVSLDGQLQLVQRLASRIPDGRLIVWTYDATGEFLSFELAHLPPDAKLVDASPAEASPAGTPAAGTTAASAESSPSAAAERAEQLAKLAVKVAEARVTAAQAAVAAVEARVAADRATYASPAASDAKDRALAAGRAEHESAARQAEANVLDAQHKLEMARGAAKPGDDKSQKTVKDAETNLLNQTKARDAAVAAAGQIKEDYSRFSPLFPPSSTGRRLALARWIASDDNPLTARVAANHIWMRHFATPLVSSVFDFGANGKAPTHPELLDRLASDLVDNDWSMKRLHRELVTSGAYRLASALRPEDAAARQVDPENTTYWRMNPRRMEAEVVRDSTLAIAEQLDRRLYGPDLDPNTGHTKPRRSLYFRNSKEKKMTFLALFDSANVVECYRRSESIAPQQALALVNSGLSLAESRLLARVLVDSTDATSDTDRQLIERAFMRILGRSPTEAERVECVAFLDAQTRQFAAGKLQAFAGDATSPVKPSADPRQRARENLVHVLFNHNDFVTIR